MSTAMIDLNTGHGHSATMTGQQQQEPIIHIAPGGGGGPPPGATQQQAPSGGGENAGTAAILARLKELESSNQALQKHIEDTKKEAQEKDEKIKHLSAEKRKDMEQMIETAIDTWLNSLTGISDEVRKQFRSGVTRIAEHADMNNAAWEVVCQASELHRMNVNKIEELMNTCNEQNETIKSLVNNNGPAPHDASFLSDASRMLGGAANGGNNKRPRPNEPSGTTTTTALPPAPAWGAGIGAAGGGIVVPVGASASAPGNAANGQTAKGDAWDLFDQLMREDGRAMYY